MFDTKQELLFEIKRFCQKNIEDIKTEKVPNDYNKGFHDACNYILTIMVFGTSLFDIQEQMSSEFEKIISIQLE